jgi:hypothetical protein
MGKSNCNKTHLLRDDPFLAFLFERFMENPIGKDVLWTAGCMLFLAVCVIFAVGLLIGAKIF